MSRNQTHRASALRSITLALLVGAAAVSARAQEAEPAPTLKVGDPAPKLQVGKWMQGEPVKELEKGKVHVVEFWATWCGPCVATIPHLNELSKKHTDVTFIGQNIWEQDESGVEPFIKKMGEKMTYRVALDDKSKESEGAMASTWMKAAGQRGIPSAFIVDKAGLVAWIGHPATMDKPLEAIIAGTYDAKAEAARAAKTDGMKRAIGQALQKGDFDAALKAADELAAADPSMAPQVGMLKFQVYTSSPKKDFAAANKLAAELATSLKDEPMALNRIAWVMATDESYEKPDLDVALKCAEAAVAASEGKDAATLDTLAAVHAKRGDNDKAVETQKKAVAASEDPDQKKQLQAKLEKYEAGGKK